VDEAAPEQTVHTVTREVLVRVAAPVAEAVALAPFALLTKSANFAPGLMAKTMPDLQCVP